MRSESHPINARAAVAVVKLLAADSHLSGIVVGGLTQIHSLHNAVALGLHATTRDFGAIEYGYIELGTERQVLVLVEPLADDVAYAVVLILQRTVYLAVGRIHRKASEGPCESLHASDDIALKVGLEQ